MVYCVGEVVKPVDCFIVGSTRVTCFNSDPVPCKGVELGVIGDEGY